MVVFVYFNIYETKGLTLEEIGRMFQESKSARASTKWVPTRDELPSTAKKEAEVGVEESEIA